MTYDRLARSLRRAGGTRISRGGRRAGASSRGSGRCSSAARACRSCPSRAPRRPHACRPGRLASSPATSAIRSSCDYWRHCAIDGFLCACCGGSQSTCPPGTEMSPVTWIGTCRNPGDGKDYMISYNDCCGRRSACAAAARAPKASGRSTTRRRTTTFSGASARRAVPCIARWPSCSGRRRSRDASVRRGSCCSSRRRARARMRRTSSTRSTARAATVPTARHAGQRAAARGLGRRFLARARRTRVSGAGARRGAGAARRRDARRGDELDARAVRQGAHPAGFVPYDAAEIGRLRTKPLTDVESVRKRLLAAIEGAP